MIESRLPRAQSRSTSNGSSNGPVGTTRRGEGLDGAERHLACQEPVPTRMTSRYTRFVGFVHFVEQKEAAT